VRAVADTNVCISSLNFGGTADEVLALGRTQAIQLLVSPSILQEVEGVLLSRIPFGRNLCHNSRTSRELGKEG